MQNIKNEIKEIQSLFSRTVDLLTTGKTALIASVVLVSGLGSFIALAMTAPAELTMINESLQSVDKPIEIKISNSIKDLAIDEIILSPSVKGNWSRVESELVFQSERDLIVDTSYRIEFPEATHINGSKVPIQAISFKTEPAPSLVPTGFTGLKDDTVIASDSELAVKLSKKNRNLREIELRTEPKLQLKMGIINDQEYRWQYDGYLPQGQEVQFEIYDTKNQQSLKKLKLKIANQPSIKERVKESNFGPNDQAIIVFDQAIDEKTRNINFSLDGDLSWRDDKTAVFKPSKIEPGKSYSYTLPKGMRSKEGGILPEEVSHRFSTVGAVTAYSPGIGNEVGRAYQEVRFNFSGSVDHQSAEQRISTNVGDISKKAWSGNTLIVGIKNMGFQRTVNVTVKAGVVNTSFGLPSNRDFVSTFTTEMRSRRLNVPHYRQEHSGTCAIASLKMTLAYRGIHRGEMALVNDMGYNPSEMDRSKSPNEWGDPFKEFVGSVDGKTWYQLAGPDAPPVAKTAIKNGRSASAVQDISAEWIASQVYNGNPVIMFGATKDTGFKTWKTPSGRIAKMNYSSHATVVVGVKGEANNPVGFWVSDPLTSGVAYWSAASVRTNISRDAYQQAVVIY